MIDVAFSMGDFDAAIDRARADIATALPAALDLLCEQVASRARAQHGYTDRSGLLTNSTQSAGVTGDIQDGYTGVVSFAARSKRSAKYPSGYLYGLVQEFGNRAGTVKGTSFVRNALNEQDGEPIEDAMARAFERAGFQVTR